MKRFFDLTFKPFFVITGIATALGTLSAFWPRWAAEKVLLIPFDQNYTIVLQHWGIMLGVMGIFMVIAAFRANVRRPILIFSAFEKSFMVYLVATNLGQSFARGLWVGAAMDATVVLYTIVYFAVSSFSAWKAKDGAHASRSIGHDPARTSSIGK
jgi:hypothetical protein